MKLYHGSDNIFEKPDVRTSFATNHDGGFGFYTVADRQIAQSYGHHLYQLDFKPQKAISDQKITLSNQQIEQLIAANLILLEDFGYDGSQPIEPFIATVLQNLVNDGNDLELINDIWHSTGSYQSTLDWLIENHYSHCTYHYRNDQKLFYVIYNVTAIKNIKRLN